MDNIFEPLSQGAVTTPLPPKFNVESKFFQFALGFDVFGPFAPNTLPGLLRLGFGVEGVNVVWMILIFRPSME